MQIYDIEILYDFGKFKHGEKYKYGLIIINPVNTLTSYQEVSLLITDDEYISNGNCNILKDRTFNLCEADFNMEEYMTTLEKVENFISIRPRLIRILGALSILLQIRIMFKYNDYTQITKHFPEYFLGIFLMYCVATFSKKFNPKYFNKSYLVKSFYLILICLFLNDPVNYSEVMSTTYFISSESMYALKVIFHCFCILAFSKQLLGEGNDSLDRK